MTACNSVPVEQLSSRQQGCSDSRINSENGTNAELRRGELTPLRHSCGRAWFSLTGHKRANNTHMSPLLCPFGPTSCSTRVSSQTLPTRSSRARSSGQEVLGKKFWARSCWPAIPGKQLLTRSWRRSEERGSLGQRVSVLCRAAWANKGSCWGKVDGASGASEPINPGRLSGTRGASQKRSPE